MKKKQTAVDWLIDQLKKVDYNPLEQNGYSKAEERLFDQAKEMEKEQIMMAVKDSWYMAKGSNFQDPQEEQYYNNTFGKVK